MHGCIQVVPNTREAAQEKIQTTRSFRITGFLIGKDRSPVERTVVCFFRQTKHGIARSFRKLDEQGMYALKNPCGTSNLTGHFVIDVDPTLVGNENETFTIGLLEFDSKLIGAEQKLTSIQANRTKVLPLRQRGIGGFVITGDQEDKHHSKDISAAFSGRNWGDKKSELDLGMITVEFEPSSRQVTSSTARTPDPESTATNLTYTRMPDDEAAGLVQELLEARKIPRGYAPSLYVNNGVGKRDELAHVWGVRINKHDYVVWALPNWRGEALHLQVQNLLDFFPPMSLPPKMDEIPGTGNAVPFVLNGVLYSTVDLEVSHRTVLARFPKDMSGVWTKTQPTIRKGGYLWYLGQVGVVLDDRMDTNILLTFNKIADYLPVKVGTAYITYMAPLPNEHDGIRVTVARDEHLDFKW